MNIGLFGFTNKHYYLATKTQEKYTKPFGSDGSLSPLDYSVGIGTGLELGHFQFMFGYDYPLSNSSKDPDLSEPRQPGGCKLKTAPVRPVVAARPAEYVCSEDLFY
ncbi:TPA: hypothetical protein KTQ38_005144 [Escherichia coli]|nr:hypothetical protein [Escherichia coli]HBH5072434.1 hypothetical protein [Escherichia coli]